jgi:hypothetical protein
MSRVARVLAGLEFGPLDALHLASRKGGDVVTPDQFGFDEESP